MAFSRRHFLSGAAAATLASSATNAVMQETGGALTPEMFGAKGDGLSNDSAAFSALARHVNSEGGGEIAFRRTTYIVGRQRPALNGAQETGYEPDPLLEFAGCSKPLIIRGNGATIKCADGLRYGTFDRRTGAATRHQQPFHGPGEVATPYRWMIKVEGCTGPVEISDLELDGNLPGLLIGGPWGDTGHQYPAIGLALVDNLGSETVRNVYTHHHPLDGVLIDGVDRARRARSSLTGVRAEYNGRQGCSIVGGRGYSFSRCKFNHTGKAGLASAPGGGVDIEAERQKAVRDLVFQACEFSNNHGCGVVADQGDSEGASFLDCTFIGTTSWAAWPFKPRFKFQSCTFVGPIVNCFGDRDRARATQFFDCRFLDDPSLSPTGQVFVGQNPDGPIADLSGNPNVLFSRCEFTLTHKAALPWTTNVVIFSDCRMSQRAPQTAYPRGTFVGSNSIRGKVDLYSAIVIGELVVNGVKVPPNR